MFGFGLKSKAKKVLDEYFDMSGYSVISWRRKLLLIQCGVKFWLYRDGFTC